MVLVHFPNVAVMRESPQTRRGFSQSLVKQGYGRTTKSYFIFEAKKCHQKKEAEVKREVVSVLIFLILINGVC